jgi:hypothetical protein
MPSGSGDLKSRDRNAATTVSGSSSRTATTERPLLVHSGMNRLMQGARSLAGTPSAAAIGSRAKLSLSRRTIFSLGTSAALR